MCWLLVPDLTSLYYTRKNNTPFYIHKLGESIIKQGGLKHTGNLDHINSIIWGQLTPIAIANKAVHKHTPSELKVATLNTINSAHVEKWVLKY